ncbi:endonuclease [Gallaecimonas kandeliae]|uniref:endonuclease n=1 Tax=Gallaecimonas kandeliae TaxID=3029055 RepID=UPI0026472210|nr:endonuclease [Gallaecimonas kandeliae]WKE66367.1 endonuclease [Gallaecimonas kandeliae]
MKTKWLLGMSLGLLASAAQAQLMLSEVLYDAPNNDNTEEFVELFNSGCSDIDLSAYALRDNNTTFALGGTLAPGAYLTVARDSAGFAALFGQQPDISGMTLALGNSGDYVQLLQGSAVVDQVAWEGGLSGWTLNATNVALYRSQFTAASTQSDWQVASNAGSPGTGPLASDCGGSGQQSGQALDNGVAKTNLAASTGQSLSFYIDVTQAPVTITSSGGSGDADLYVKAGSAPTTNDYDCRSISDTTNESCQVNATGRVYVELYSYASYSGVSLTASFDAGSTGGSTGGTGGSTDDYYAPVLGKTGNDLRVALNALLQQNQVHFTYTQVWDQLEYTDEDPNNTNNVILLYSGRSEPKSMRAGQSNDPDAWNREHVWAKSHGFPDSSQWAYTDINHLRPADVTINSARSNKDFDMGGTPLAESPSNKTDDDSFEPSDNVKGDVARMLFYMDVRYEGNDGSGVPDLTLVDHTGTSGAELGKLCTLVQWAAQDPVSDWERRRNARVFERQHNRNPFIDHPEWIQSIFGASCP